MRRSKEVTQYTKDMVAVATYPSARKAAEANGYSVTAISLNCLGRTKNCGSYIFIYTKREEPKPQPKQDKGKAVDLYGRAFAYALSLTGNEEDSHDLVQEAFLRYYETEATGKSAVGFLLQTIKYEWFKEQSRRSFTAPIEDYTFFLSSEDEEEVSERIERDSKADSLSKDLEKQVKAALASIKTEKRRKRYGNLFHWYLQGMSAAEVGKMLNVQVQSAKQEIIKMRRFVSQALDIPMREFTQYNCRIA